MSKNILFESTNKDLYCTECGNCCRECHPIINEDDIKRMSGSMSLEKEVFINSFLKKDEDGDFIFNLKPCPLLKENKCSQYENRPEDCRSYPHLHKEDFRSRLFDILGNIGICPIVYNVYERLKFEFPGWEEEVRFF